MSAIRLQLTGSGFSASWIPASGMRVGFERDEAAELIGVEDFSVSPMLDR
jgi:hypothetical protein